MKVATLAFIAYTLLVEILNYFSLSCLCLIFLGISLVSFGEKMHD